MIKPSKLNIYLIEGMAIEIESGLPICYVCDLFGITKPAYTHWMNQGQYDYENEVSSLHATLYINIKKAYARFIKNAKKIISTGTSGWQGMAWWLERTNKEFQMNTSDINVPENITINTRMRTKKKDK